MSALARYFHSLGKKVMGYDKTETQLTRKLQEEGIAITFTDEISSEIKDLKKEDTLDDLPDLGMSANHSMANDDGQSESDFSSKGVAKPRNKAQEQMNDKDTVLIAKAISTVLAKDKE